MQERDRKADRREKPTNEDGRLLHVPAFLLDVHLAFNQSIHLPCLFDYDRMFRFISLDQINVRVANHHSIQLSHMRRTQTLLMEYC